MKQNDVLILLNSVQLLSGCLLSSLKLLSVLSVRERERESIVVKTHLSILSHFTVVALLSSSSNTFSAPSSSWRRLLKSVGDRATELWRCRPRPSLSVCLPGVSQSVMRKSSIQSMNEWTAKTTWHVIVIWRWRTRPLDLVLLQSAILLPTRLYIKNIKLMWISLYNHIYEFYRSECVEEKETT